MQQVNLYVPELKPKRIWFCGSNIFIFFIFFIVLNVSFFFYEKSRLASLETELSDKNKIFEQYEARLEVAKKAVDPSKKEHLKKNIDRLREEITSLQMLEIALSQQNIGNRILFSDALEHMAVQSDTGISINKFRYSHGGLFVEIAGLSRKPEYVPDFLGRLSTTSVFKNSSFGVMHIEDDNNTKFTRFHIGFSEDLKMSKKLSKR